MKTATFVNNIDSDENSVWEFVGLDASRDEIDNAHFNTRVQNYFTKTCKVSVKQAERIERLTNQDDIPFEVHPHGKFTRIFEY